jgi:hypothetical protein
MHKSTVYFSTVSILIRPKIITFSVGWLELLVANEGIPRPRKFGKSGLGIYYMSTAQNARLYTNESNAHEKRRKDLKTRVKLNQMIEINCSKLHKTVWQTAKKKTPIT